MFRKIPLLFALCAAMCFNVAGQTEALRIERLSNLAKVWGAVKYFHPFPAYRDIDWDRALIETIPKVNAANSSEEYAAAINSMLAALGDKNTRAEISLGKPEVKNQLSGAAKEPIRLENGVLIYDGMAAARLTYQEYSRLDAIAANAGKLFPNARAILIDARANGETDELIIAELDYQLKNILPLMLDRNVTLGTIRYRMHNGYATQSGESSGGYYSAFVTDAPETLAGDAATKTPPIIFLVDEKNKISPIISGLQAAGKAFVVADGASAAGGDFYSMKLSENLRVEMRTTELVNPDGSINFAPDFVAAKGTAMPEALRILAADEFAANRPKTVSVPAAQVSQKDKTYAEMDFPNREYRLLALFRFWNVINYFAPYKELIGTNWDTILPKYIPQFEANKNALEYRVTAQEMLAEIRDSHGFFSAPPLKNAPVNFYPPFIESYAEDKLFIKTVLEENSGFKPGDVILETDGELIQKLIDKYARRIAASTPHALMREVKNRGVFRGAKDSKMTVKVLGLDGKVRQIETTRNTGFDSRILGLRLPTRETPIVSILPSGAAYVDLDRLSTEDIDRMFEKTKNAPAVIFDMRGYPKGDVSPIFARLTNKPLSPGIFSRPLREAKNFGDSSFADGTTYNFLLNNDARKKPSSEIYQGKIVMLINEVTQSAAEGVANQFAAARPDLTFVGTPTAGANGDITYGVLPGNIKFSFSGHSVRRADGSQLQRVGVQPTIKVAPTIRGIIEGKDEVLEAAIKLLQTQP